MPTTETATSPRARNAASGMFTRPAGDGPLARVRPMGDAAIFACAGMENTTYRHAVTIMCSTGPEPLQVECEGQTIEGHVLVIKPMVFKTVRAMNLPLVLVDMEPSHPQYRYFHSVAAPGVQALPVARCPVFMDMARSFAAATLCGAELDRTARKAIDEIAKQFPEPAALDRRVLQLMYMLAETPGDDLDSMAASLGMSAHHASRLFSNGLGLPLRRYVLSCKIRAATSFLGSERMLTEIAVASGFVDSAHFAKVWTQGYGYPPSQFYNPEQTLVDTLELPDWLVWYLAHRDANLPRGQTDASTPWLYRPDSKRP
jgi:AraC-like DNA-binding protein